MLNGKSVLLGKDGKPLKPTTITMAAYKSFEKVMSGVSCTSMTSDDKVDNIPVTKTNVETPSSYASEISLTSSIKANF